MFEPAKPNAWFPFFEEFASRADDGGEVPGGADARGGRELIVKAWLAGLLPGKQRLSQWDGDSLVGLIRAVGSGKRQGNREGRGRRERALGGLLGDRTGMAAGWYVAL